MTDSRPQPDSPPDSAVYISYSAESPLDVALLVSLGLEVASVHPHQENATALPAPRNQNGKGKRRIQDHPQWASYLSQRRILEPAIAAEAWVEHEEWSGQDVLVWRTRRRDGSPGATRRRLLKRVKVKGKRQAKVRWQYGGEKTDEPFYYVGTLEDLKREIARAGGKVYIVEGEFDVWSLHRLGILNVIGIYGISNIPKDIGAILDEISAASFAYLMDNDRAGDIGASNLRSLLHGSEWKGEGEYRKVEGAGIPEKGDANDLLRCHFPDLAAARAALETLAPL